MRHTHSLPSALKRLGIITLSAACLQLSACSPSSEALYEQARKAAEAKNFDEALTLFEQMKREEGATLEQRYQAGFGSAEVHLARGDIKAQAAALEALLQDKSMAPYRDTLVIKLEDSYLKRAEELGLGDPQLIPLLRKAIELNPQSKARQLLTERYMARGLEELKAEHFDEAEQHLISAQELKSADTPLNAKVAQHLREARLKRYMKRAQKIIDAQQDELAQRVGYNRSEQRFSLSVEVQIEGRVSRRNAEELTTKATPLAEAAMSARVAQLLKELLNEPNEGEPNASLIQSTSWTTGAITLAKRSKRVKRDKKRVWLTSMSYEASLSLEEFLRLAFRVHEQAPAVEPAAEPAAEPTAEPAAQ
jgi:hypothetical protein